MLRRKLQSSIASCKPFLASKKHHFATGLSTVPPFNYFPYGNSSFQKIRSHNHFWYDNSRYIFDLVENENDHQLFLRPPRWGKSLFMNMLQCYLDVNEEKNFDDLFKGTDIFKMGKQLKHKNKYHVMKFDFSVDVTDTDPMAIKKEFDQKIELSVERFCYRYKMSWNDLKTPSVLGTMERVINKAIDLQDANIFVLVDEYDRFANELMFNNPDTYDKIVAGVSGDKHSSPVRSFFSTIKSLTEVRSFTTGLSPIALADSSSANNIDFITQNPRFANMLGFPESAVECALKKLFEEKDVPKAMEVARKFFNGYRFPYHPRYPAGEPLYTPQLCLLFFSKCVDPSFRQDVLDDRVTDSDMQDPGVKPSSNVVQLLSKRSELPSIFSSLKADGVVDGATVEESFKLGDLKSKPGRDLPVSFLVWHGMLTRGNNGAFQIPNRIMGDPNCLLQSCLSEFVRGADRVKADALAVVQTPTGQGLWELLTYSMKDINTPPNNSISEGAIQMALEQFFRQACPNIVVQTETSVLTQRFDMCLSAHSGKLLIEYKRLRPGGGSNPADLPNVKTLATVFSNVDARNLLEKQPIEARKQCLHGGAKTVGELECLAKSQVQTYKDNMVNSGNIRCATVIHATVAEGRGPNTRYTSAFLVNVL